MKVFLSIFSAVEEKSWLNDPLTLWFLLFTVPHATILSSIHPKSYVQTVSLLNKIFIFLSHAGEYLSLEEVNAMVAPKKTSVDAIEGWLRAHDITQFSYTGRDFLVAHATVAQVETLLQTTYYVYRHSISGHEIVRVGSAYSVPSSVASHIDFIGGLAHFPKTLGTKSKLQKTTTAPQIEVTPQVIKKFFGIDPATTANQTGNSQAVAQFLEQYYDPKDLTTFQTRFNLPKQAVTLVFGPNQPNNPGIEASLDIEYILALAPGAPTWFVYTAGLVDGQEPFLDWITNISSTPNSPLVHSISYGDIEHTVSFSFTARVDVEFQKYGVTGRSILFASGDDGTGCYKLCSKFEPNWPASSAYVTSVGGIALKSSTTATGDEISSGGFSDYYSQPSYQADAVKAYVSAHTSPSSSFYNASGRAMPDIASFSEDVTIVVGGESGGVGGTSCAAPVVAGIITLLNDARLAAGKKSLGFLNPFLYQTLAAHPDAFIDITTGSNAQGCCLHGFEAAKGWDPITGVGAPNFPTLKQYALAV